MARPRNRTRALDVLFADTVFWFGLARNRDQHRARAKAWKAWLDAEGARLVTTEAVLWEWLNAAADVQTRQAAVAGYLECQQELRLTIAPFTKERISKAVTLYEARHDKEWSLTDCLSFIVMEEMHLGCALTTDHHFEQAGFRALLLEDPPQ